MRKALLALVAVCGLALAVNAAEGEKKEHAKGSSEHQAVMKEMLAKYDLNKDGKLDKEERAKMTPEDKAKLKEAGGQKKAKKEKETK